VLIGGHEIHPCHLDLMEYRSGVMDARRPSTSTPISVEASQARMSWNVTCRFVGLVDHALVPPDLKKRIELPHYTQFVSAGGPNVLFSEPGTPRFNGKVRPP
jgi:hypothetical protein